MAGRYFDFDETVKAGEPIRFKVCGDEYELPGDIPMGQALRWRKEGQEATEDADAFATKVMREIMGDAAFERLVEKASVPQFNAVTNMVMTELFGVSSDAEEEVPKAQTAAETPSPTSTSSYTGLRSVPTSPGITHSLPAASSQ